MVLYEYARNNPVKSYRTKNYTFYIKNRYGGKYVFTGRIYKNSDRISLTRKNSKILHEAMLEGGTVRIKIQEQDRPTNYIFEIDSTYYQYYFDQL